MHLDASLRDFCACRPYGRFQALLQGIYRGNENLENAVQSKHVRCSRKGPVKVKGRQGRPTLPEHWTLCLKKPCCCLA